MGIMRKTLMRRLQSELSIPVKETYGYITKLLRETHFIQKSHVNDARCIARVPDAQPSDTLYRIRAVRHHNRQLHKTNPIKGGIRKRNQAPYEVFGFHLWDKVLFNGQECFISGRRAKGYFALKDFNGKKVHASVSLKVLTVVESATNYLIERRDAAPPHS